MMTITQFPCRSCWQWKLIQTSLWIFAFGSTFLHTEAQAELPLPTVSTLGRTPVPSVVIHVAALGHDTNPGTEAEPLATLAAAQTAARKFAGHAPVTVTIHQGTYYLPETLRFNPVDSGTQDFPVAYTAAPGAKPIISGGMPLQLEWSQRPDQLWEARTPPDLSIDQLFVNGERQSMARYPNYDASAEKFGGTAADAIAPERVARWANPEGGFIHAMHEALWGDMHWRILGKKADGSLNYEGGWQNNRASQMHKEFRFVENIREELDAAGEWFHDRTHNLLLVKPPTGTDLRTATVEAVRLRHLVEFKGTQETRVRFVSLRGLTFKHSARTFMENREPLLRSDWTIYRGGAVIFENAEDAGIDDCDFDQLGGNAIFVNNFNRRIHIRQCLIRETGANGVAFVGNPGAVRSPLFNYSTPNDYRMLDRTAGPQTEDFPADCLVEDCLITRSGRFEKQTAPVQIAMAQGITVRHCSIYAVPRAGINIGDGCWGGHVIEFCDIFDTVLETGDHGSFNSWGRDRYWSPDVRVVDQQVAADPSLPFLDAVQPVILRNNRWRCDHGWDIDLDDGSSNYQITNNLLLHGGLKMREGFQRTATNNIILNNSLHPHVWFENSGDVFSRNIVMGPYQPAIMEIARWGKDVNHNLFTISDADRTSYAPQGCDHDSLVGDPQFVNAEIGDFRVKDGSPALKLGFVNFPMDQFGVQSLRLKALACTPEMEIASANQPAATAVRTKWQGATLRELTGQEFSALGVPAGATGVMVVDTAADSAAFQIGLRQGDFIEQVNGLTVLGVRSFQTLATGATDAQRLKLGIVRNQQKLTLEQAR